MRYCPYNKWRNAKVGILLRISIANVYNGEKRKAVSVMASGRMEFHAQSIMQHASFSFVLPNDVEMAEVREPRHYDRPTKTLILLHGLTGTDTDWLLRDETIA
jgi:hypothetical protein